MTSPASPTGLRPESRRFLLGVLVLALLSSGWALSRAWSASIRDAHEFRQLQTALTAHYLKQDGFKLAYETPVLGPPWSIPLEFPTYQAVVAWFSRATGVPLEQSGRAVGILAFYAALPAAWLLLRRRLPGPLDPLPAIAALLVCPLYLFYTRAFMIESTALCLAAWFVAGFDRVLARPTIPVLLASWLVGALGAATKVTTFGAAAFACALLLLEHTATRRRAGQALGAAALRTAGLAGLVSIVPLLTGVAWVVYSDHLKELNPFGHYITSTSLHAFNFGTLAQRASLEWWRALGYITAHSVLAWPGLLLLAAGLWASPPAYRRVSLACVLSYPAGALFFANLYYVHDYYSYASAGFLVVAAGVAAAGLLRSPRVSPVVTGLLIILGLGGQVAAFRTSYYYFYDHPNAPIPPETALIRAVTPPDDVIAGIGFDWNSLLPYYSQRRALMPFDSHANDFAALDRSLAALGHRRVSTLLIARRHRDDRNFVDILIGKFAMCSKPIARTDTMDIYVRRDRASAAVQALAGRPDWHAELNLRPADSAVVLTEHHELGSLPWLASLTDVAPLPFLSKGPYTLNYLEADGRRSLLTQAPTEIHFHPPPGSRSVSAVTGMLPSAYTPPNNTPGVLIAVFEEMPDGTRHPIFERLLMPVTEARDRGDVVIEYTQDQPFTGTLIFAHYPVPSGNVSFSWSYWQRVRIH